ncbi:single-stranded DNA-binding protein [Polluticaenibacter yanchengensis]|uniref:Single-stranded DNA-binding protein n=1 Tax=Polluticaenibacter yanchengensis TaxID=3014562 RepID=A0ABT4UHN1_9BACT|nr:single-stranded DNA-binding protein [Chitinophagaceae bacterium LY-5]
MIKLQVIGNLGKDSTTNTVNGKSVINFSVAHTERFKDSSGENKERVIWVECAYWSDRTAVGQYLLKGQLVYVEGTPELRTYQKNDGTQGASLSLRVLNIQLLGSRNQGGNGNGGSQTDGSNYNNQYNTGSTQPSVVPPASAPSSPVDDDLPF